MKRQILNLAVMAATVFTAQAQMVAPGAVGTPEVWFVTTPETDDANGKYKWTDISAEPSVLLRANSAEEASAKREDIHTYNFYPALPFDSTVSHQFTVKGTDLPQRTIIGVFGGKVGNDLTSGNGLYGIAGLKGNERMLSRVKVVYKNSEGVKVFSYDGMKSKNDKETERVKVLSYLEANGSKYSLWNQAEGARIGIGGKPIMTLWGDEEVFDEESIKDISARTFYSPEFIVYGRSLTPFHRRLVETYLALKYGITLTDNYISHSYPLLWDVKKDYGNRVFGYGRDSIANFYQQTSTTTYEHEDVNIKNQDEIRVLNIDETYHLANSYNLSSEANLIVAGFESMAGIPDNTYVIFGDNGNEPKTENPSDRPWNRNKHNVDYTDTLKIMNRKWEVKTFGLKQMPAASSPLLDLDNILLKEEKSFNFNISSEDESLPGFAATNSTIIGDVASISFYPASLIGSNTSYVIKFGGKTKKVEIGDYGVRIDADGFYVISNGKSNKINQRINKNTLIEIEKIKNKFIVRADGNAIYDSEFDENALTFASFLLNGSAYAKNIHLAGFEYSGHKVELSYNLTNDSAFAPDASHDLYLMVSKTGNFLDTENCVMYSVSGHDKARHKAIFHNVEFLDSCCYFTFAYKGASAQIEEDKYDFQIFVNNPLCDGAYPVNNSGSVKVILPEGVKYEYAIGSLNEGFSNTNNTSFSPYVEATDSIVETNLGLTNYNHALGVNSGMYRIVAAPAGYPSFDFSGDGTHLMNSDRAIFTSTKSSIEWIVGAETDTSEVGYIMPGSDNNRVDFGLRIVNGRLYRLFYTCGNGLKWPVQSWFQSVTVNVGDRMRIERIDSEIFFYHNGVLLNKKGLEMNIDCYKFGNDNGTLIVKNKGEAVKQLKVDDKTYRDNIFRPIGFEPYAPMFTSYGSGSVMVHGSLDYSFEIRSDCQEEKRGDKNVVIYAEGNSIVVHGTYENDSNITIEVFNEVANTILPKHIETHTTEFETVYKNLMAGVYIVVVSSQGNIDVVEKIVVGAR